MNTPYYSIRQPTPGPFNTIIIQPHFLQWVINQLPLMLIVVAGVLLCGMDSIMFKGVLIVLTVFSSFSYSTPLSMYAVSSTASPTSR